EQWPTAESKSHARREIELNVETRNEIENKTKVKIEYGGSKSKVRTRPESGMRSIGYPMQERGLERTIKVERNRRRNKKKKDIE
ncbi:hypothetical protein EVAR_51155_1, partial [Eumeta japonica]